MSARKREQFRFDQTHTHTHTNTYMYSTTVRRGYVCGEEKNSLGAQSGALFRNWKVPSAKVGVGPKIHVFVACVVPAIIAFVFPLGRTLPAERGVRSDTKGPQLFAHGLAHVLLISYLRLVFDGLFDSFDSRPSGAKNAQGAFYCCCWCCSLFPEEKVDVTRQYKIVRQKMWCS